MAAACCFVRKSGAVLRGEDEWQILAGREERFGRDAFRVAAPFAGRDRRAAAAGDRNGRSEREDVDDDDDRIRGSGAKAGETPVEADGEWRLIGEHQKDREDRRGRLSSTG